MIAHVAASGEGRGRVVVHLAPSGRLSDAALAAALLLAKAFQSEIETIFVADEEVLALAQYPFAREIGLSGRTSRSLTLKDVEAELANLASGLQRRVADMARQCEVLCSGRLGRGELVKVLAEACAEPGPWNALVLTAPPGDLDERVLGRLFEEVSGTTGIVVAGRSASAAPAEGPIAALVEDIEDIPQLLRSAARLAIEPSQGLRLVLAAHSESEAAWMDGQARLALGDGETVPMGTMMVPADGGRTVVQHLNALQPRLVVARFARPLGEVLATRPDTLADLKSSLLLLR